MPGAGGAGARCAALALSALKAACATCATCAPRSFVVGSAVEPIQEVGVEELPKDLELVPGKRKVLGCFALRL